MKKIYIKIIVVAMLMVLFIYTANIRGDSYVQAQSTTSKKNITVKVVSVSKKKIKLKFTNKGRADFNYTPSFVLKKRKNGKWKKVKFKEDALFSKTLFKLKGNSSRTHTIVWKNFFDGNLSKGEYKITWVKDKKFKIK